MFKCRGNADMDCGANTVLGTAAAAAGVAGTGCIASAAIAPSVAAAAAAAGTVASPSLLLSSAFVPGLFGLVLVWFWFSEGNCTE